MQNVLAAAAAAKSREGNGNPLQYSCLENPMDGGAWWAAVRGVAKSRIRLSDFAFTFHFHALEKEMATHSSVLAWRIPGTGEPGGLPSMGSHRVGHDWSDLAAAAAAAACSPRDSLQISLQSKGLFQHHSSKASVLQHSAFFMAQFSHPYMTTGKSIALTRRTFVGKVMSLLFNIFSRLVIAFLPRSKSLFISWLQSLSAMILEPKNIKSLTVPFVSPSISPSIRSWPCDRDLREGNPTWFLVSMECQARGVVITWGI